MITLKKQKACLSILTGVLVLSACVDNKYDLSNINTDTIEIGEDIVVPLGTGSIEAKKLLDVDDVEEIKVINGEYYVLYQDSLEVKMPTDMDIESKSVELSIDLDAAPESNIAIPADEKIPLEGISAEEDLTFDGQTEEIQRIDSVLFENSTLNLIISLKDYAIQSGSANLMLDINFPEGFELQSNHPSYILKNNHSLTVKVSINDLKRSIELPITVKKAVQGEIKVDNLNIEVTSPATFKKGYKPALNIDLDFDDLNYKIIYGAFDIDFSSDKPNTIDMKDFKDIFEEGDNTLSFADPHIKLVTKSNIGIPLNCDLLLKSINDKGRSESTTISGIKIAAADANTIAYSKWWVGPKEPADKNPNDGFPGGAYTHKANSDIPEILKIVPTSLDVDLNIQSEHQPVQFFTNDAFARVNYIVEIPFSPASDFKMDVSETIDKAFDEDLIEYVFSNGTVTISGEVANSFPLKFSMNLDIVDETGQSVGIKFDAKEVAGSKDGQAVKSTVSYKIEEKDMPKMATARDIKVLLKIEGDTNLNGTVKDTQKLDLNLKLQKSGGIVINKD